MLSTSSDYSSCSQTARKITSYRQTLAPDTSISPSFPPSPAGARRAGLAFRRRDAPAPLETSCDGRISSLCTASAKILICVVDIAHTRDTSINSLYSASVAMLFVRFLKFLWAIRFCSFRLSFGSVTLSHSGAISPGLNILRRLPFLTAPTTTVSSTLPRPRALAPEASWAYR